MKRLYYILFCLLFFCQLRGQQATLIIIPEKENKEISYQFSELGKVDFGGGGTIAYIMANYGMEVIDSGVAVLNMHAPYEVSSKADVYQAVRGYKAFLGWNE